MDGATITLGGHTLRVASQIIQHYAEIEQQILRTRENPFLLAKQNMDLFPDDLESKKLLLQLAMEVATHRPNYVSRQELFDWIETTFDGFAFMTFLAIRDNDPKTYTFQRVKELLIAEMENVGRDSFEKRKHEIEQAVNSSSGGG